MKALMLAAGVGQRLYGDNDRQPPKALLRFDGRTLLSRHIENLRALGVDELVLVVGYRSDEVMAEAMAAGDGGFVRSLYNPDFRSGPVVSLWTGRPVLTAGDSVLFMDADVLYHPRLLERLIRSPHDNCFLLDRAVEEGEDPVRLCIRDGLVVDFGKRVEGRFDVVGEWPGFLRMSPRIAARLATAAQAYIDGGNPDAVYEEAMRDVLVSEPPGTFGFEDITGIPWVEIDYPSDLMRANKDIFPRIRALARGIGRQAVAEVPARRGGKALGC